MLAGGPYSATGEGAIQRVPASAPAAPALLRGGHARLLPPHRLRPLLGCPPQALTAGACNHADVRADHRLRLVLYQARQCTLVVGYTHAYSCGHGDYHNDSAGMVAGARDALWLLNDYIQVGTVILFDELVRCLLCAWYGLMQRLYQATHPANWHDTSLYCLHHGSTLSDHQPTCTPPSRICWSVSKTGQVPGLCKGWAPWSMPLTQRMRAGELCQLSRPRAASAVGVAGPHRRQGEQVHNDLVLVAGTPCLGHTDSAAWDQTHPDLIWSRAHPVISSSPWWSHQSRPLDHRHSDGRH